MFVYHIIIDYQYVLFLCLLNRETLDSESESSAEDDVEEQKGVAQQTAVPQQQVLPVPATNDDNSEPEFHTDKERECWRLYRKMCEKGVSVSYDTVLR